MDILKNIVGIYLSPKEIFKYIDKKPTWKIPFIVSIIIAIVINFLIMDINIKDQLDRLKAHNVSHDQIEITKTWLEGNIKYIQIFAIPIWYLVVWWAQTCFILFSGNIIMDGNIRFIKVFSVVAWSSLVSLLGEIIETFLILSKGTIVGVTLSLAIFLPTLKIDQKPPTLYRFLAMFDIFIIWQFVLWTIGLSVLYRFPIKKSVKLVLSLWVVWILIRVIFLGDIVLGDLIVL